MSPDFKRILFSGDGRFYILALSQKYLKLFQATHYSISEVELEGIPKSLSDALGYDNLEEHLQFHTGTPAREKKRAAMFHGHGGARDVHKDNILRYFQIVDKALNNSLQEKERPLVLAGVDYLLPIYKEANSYPHLFEEGIQGNPEELNEKVLHQQAWQLVQPFFLKSQKEALASFEQLSGTDQVSDDLKTIFPSAYHGRVGVLFVALGVQKWGTFDPVKNMVTLDAQAKPENYDLLDFAAVQTLLKGGAVYVLEPEKVPHKAPLAAIFRY